MTRMTTNHVKIISLLATKKPSKAAAISVVVAAVIGVASLPAAANKYHQKSRYNNGSEYASSNALFDYAHVVNVNPVVETYKINKPVEQCWDEHVPVRSRYSESHARSKTKTPEIVGAIIGGLIGNQVGKRGGGKARDVATVAGAVLGGSIGRDTKQVSRRHNGGYERSRYTIVERCDMQDSYITQEQVVGYDVEYRYRGRLFHTQMADHPGKKIKVEITVNPI